MGVPPATNSHWWDGWTLIILLKTVGLKIRRQGYFIFRMRPSWCPACLCFRGGATLITLRRCSLSFPTATRLSWGHDKFRIVSLPLQMRSSQTMNLSKLWRKPRKFARDLWPPHPSLHLCLSIRFFLLSVCCVCYTWKVPVPQFQLTDFLRIVNSR